MKCQSSIYLSIIFFLLHTLSDSFIGCCWILFYGYSIPQKVRNKSKLHFNFSFSFSGQSEKGYNHSQSEIVVYGRIKNHKFRKESSGETSGSQNLWQLFQLVHGSNFRYCCHHLAPDNHKNTGDSLG